MSDPTRARIRTAFDEELNSAPAPAGLRAMAVRAAVTAPPERTPRPALLALVAALVAVALVATLVIGSNALRHNPTPARTRPAPSVLPPSPRSEAALVYDGAHGELVLFGGTDVRSKTVNETWTWDGKAWREYNLKIAPSARQGAAAAYDGARKDVVVFGGVPNLDDTWTWDGSVWKQRHPSHVPPLSFNWPASMAYDPASKRVILYGFEDVTSGNQGNMVAETWSWDGSDWTRFAAASGPMQTGSLVESRGQLYLMAAGFTRIGGRYATDMWRWDTTTWTRAGSFVQPFGAFMVEDQARGDLLGFDGDTWTFDGSAWTRQHPQSVPPSAGYLAYFAPLHEVVMWGDVNGNSSNAMWAWDGADWKEIAAGTMPAIVPPAGRFGPVTPAAASTLIRGTVKTASPVLLPGWLPDGMEAGGTVTTDFFSVDYRSDQRDRTISFAIAVANPPPGDDNSTSTRVPFRHALAPKYGTSGQADYFVYDKTAPRSDRWLMWTEPGRSNGGLIGGPDTGVPYFLYASGLTDAEFWQVANSLR